MDKKITRTIDNITVTVNYTKTVVYADSNAKLGASTFENAEMTVEKNGKKAKCNDKNFFYPLRKEEIERMGNAMIFARFGNTYVSEPVYNVIKTVLAEAKAACEEPEEFGVVRTKEIARTEKEGREAREYAKIVAARKAHPGWCDKCQSYCYGDCQANS